MLPGIPSSFLFFGSKPVITLSSWSGVIIYWMLPEHLSQVQLAELIDSLDKEYWEADLYAALQEIRDEVHTHMDITEDLTNKARGSNKCFLTAANGKEIIIFSPLHKIGSDSLRYSLLLSLIMLERRMISFKLKVIFSPFSSCLSFLIPACVLASTHECHPVIDGLAIGINSAIM